MKRSSGASGKTIPSPDKLQKTLEQALRNGCDMVPCPACGLFQPEMVLMARKSQTLGESLSLISFVAGGLTALLIYLQAWPRFAAFLWLLIGASAFGIPRSATINPNAHIKERKIERGFPVRSRGQPPAAETSSCWEYSP